MKNGPGRFFHLDHGQLFEGFWVDNVAKCGTMIDFGRDEAPEPTQFPIPKVGTPRDRKWCPRSHIHPGQAYPSPARPGNRQGFVLSRGIPMETGSSLQGRQHLQSRQRPKAGSLCLPCSPIQPLTVALQIKILDPDGVLEEAMATFRKTEED